MSDEIRRYPVEPDNYYTQPVTLDTDDCSGAADCSASSHLHGCFADDPCTHPGEALNPPAHRRSLVDVSQIARRMAAISEWIDASYPSTLCAEAVDRRRIDKLAEEVGEVIDAYGGMVGENPRKGVTHTLDQVLDELLDVAGGALGAYEHLTGNRGLCMEALAYANERVFKRAGLTAMPDFPLLDNSPPPVEPAPEAAP